MLFPKDEIISDIDTQIKTKGGICSDWYVGVAKDSQEAFFKTHLVEDKNDGFLYREAFTPGCAREIKDYFVTQRGAAVDPSSTGAGRIVYAYRKIPVESGERIGNGHFDVVR